MARDWDHYPDGRPIFFDRQGKPMTRDQYAEAKYESDEYRRIGLDTYPDLTDAIRAEDPLAATKSVVTVSTVWLGIDHGFGFVSAGSDENYQPIIFETMIFSGDDMVDTQCTRYATESQAIEGHWRTINDLRNGQVPWFLRSDDEEAEVDG